jgi:glycosyltransferase involved in cell wall biosynthesis
MHFVHVVQMYHPVTSGSVKFFVELGQQLVRGGHRVTILTTTAAELEAFWLPSKNEYPAVTETHLGTTIIRFPIRRFAPHPLIYPIMRRLLVELGRLRCPVNLMRWLSALTPRTPQLTDWIITNSADIDVIHVTNVTLDGLIHPVIDAAERAGIPVIATPFIHLGEATDASLVRYYEMPQQLDILHRSRAVFVMTARERRFVVGHGVSDALVHVVGAGVTPTEVIGGNGASFRDRHQVSGPIILQIGAMARDKGTLTTIDAMRVLWQKGSDASLVLIGAPLEHFVTAFAALPNDIRRRIVLLAHASDDDKRDALAAAALLVLPSRTDSFGIVFLEAWCNQLAVIGADAGGIPDVIADGVDGLLVPFDDRQQLATAIESLLADPARAHQYATAGMEKVARLYTWDAIGAAMVPVCVAAGTPRV